MLLYLTSYLPYILVVSTATILKFYQQVLMVSTPTHER